MGTRYVCMSLCSVLCGAAVVSAAPEVVVYDGTHTGTINGGSMQAKVDGTVDSGNGDITATIELIQRPPGNFDVIISGGSYLCVSCSNSWYSPSDECHVPNFREILGGAGTYWHTRQYTFPSYPNNTSLTVDANFSVSPGRLDYTADWNGVTNALPTNLVDVLEYTQVLTPVGDGLVAVGGSALITRSNGDDPLPIRWTGLYDLGAGHNLPVQTDGTIDLDFQPNGDRTFFNVTGTTFGEGTACPDNCTGGEVIKKATCRTDAGLVVVVVIVIAGATPGEEYTAVLDSGQRLARTANDRGKAKFAFKGNSRPGCGHNGVTVCGKRRSFTCGC